MAAKKNRAVYQFKVTLRDIHLPIWRRIQVWEDTTLAQLHRVLQVVLGWEDYHLHEFVIGRKIYCVPDPDDERTIIDEKRARIHQVIHRVGTEFEYGYDFGDDWRHDLLLEAILQPVCDTAYPRCVAGERSCPPEDVGGSSGYEDYLEALADPMHEEHEDVVKWRGPFDPEAFSLADINQQLEKRFRPIRMRAVSRTPSNPTTTNDYGPDKTSSFRALWAASGVPLKDLKRIPRNEKVPLELNDRERELIQWHTFADGALTDRLRVVPKTGEPPVFHFTLDDLDELAGFVASEANHAKNRKLQKEWLQLCDRIEAVLEGYTDEDD